MRVTNGMLSNNFRNNLSRNYQNLNSSLIKSYTGKKVLRFSEDTISSRTAMRSRERLSKLQQYENNMNNARSWFEYTESSLSELSGIVARAYELTVYAANGTKTPEDFQTISKEITQLRDAAVDILNTTYGDRYIFGGYNTSTQPFNYNKDTGELKYNGIGVTNPSNDDAAKLNLMKGQQISYEISENSVIEVSISGVRCTGIGDKNLIASFDKVLKSLTGPDGLDDSSISEMQEHQTNILTLVSEVGSKINRIDVTESKNSLDKMNYEKLLSASEDIDFEEAIMKYRNAEAIYQATLAAGSKIIQPSLLDFLN